jgi:glycyl-tRNA synthetase
MTSLQGTMGRVYALRGGHPRPVADAIYEHWLPRSADDLLPASKAGTLLAIADRLDSLVGLFAAGVTPQATADPYGLRRAALGVIQLLIKNNLDLDLGDAVDIVAAEMPIEVSADAKAQVLEFIAGRLRVWLDEQGWVFDVSAAVLAAQAHNPARALQGIKELSEWVKREDWETTLDAFARCVRITKVDTEHYTVDPAKFAQDEERNLYSAYQSAAAKLDRNGGVDNFLTAFVPIIPAITAFFGTGKGDGVLVNAPEQDLRENRHAVLQAISAMQSGRADLSHLSGF